MNKNVVIIPTYNEVDNIGNLIKKIIDLNLSLDILVVDDNSPDGTGRAAENLARECPEVKVIHCRKKNGLGVAYSTGFKKAFEEGYEYIICMDGDLSHNPQYIPQFLDKIAGCDLVLGSRFLNGIHIINWSFFRLCLSLSAIQYVRLVTGMPFSDPLGGFRCFRRKTLESIAKDGFVSKGYIFQAETLYKIYRKGYKILEIPITFIDRTIGKSKLSLSIILEALFKIFILRFKA
ncbi:polyprenol monophosphomannose synthase [bacterium]|nr:MAG: polyprenol monophosphomannose synthase [bacterium]